MSAGHQFIRACADTGMGGVFRKAPRQQFTEEELPYYDFAVRYLTNFASFPTLQAFSQAQLPISEHVTDQPPAALLDRLGVRYAFNAVRDRQPSLTESLRARDMESVEVLLREMLAGVTGAHLANASVTMEDQARIVLAQCEAARTHEGLFGASLCWPTLDAATRGLAGGELAFFVARPGVGKSWALLSVANANHLLGKSVLFISMEMGLDQITRRWLGVMTGVNPNLMRTGMTSMHETGILQHTAQQLGNRAPIHLVSGDLNKDVGGIEALIDDKGPDVVCIDALYLLRSGGMDHLKKWEALTDVVRAVKRMGLSRNIPIISTVQFNRNQKATSTNRSMDLSDISGADAIPQDASVVVGLRPYAAPHTRTRRFGEILKNREGDESQFAIEFNFDPVRFNEVPLELEEEEDEEGVAQWMV